MKRSSLALAYLMAAALPAAAAEPLSETSLGQVVVTATKTEIALEDAPGGVTVVTREQMEARGIRSLDQALTYVAGARQKRTKGLADATPSVTLRGFDGQSRTLVLLDGVPLNDGYSTGVEWGAVPVEDVERIEVVRGAASALHGGGAMGGVIHIITKNPDRWRAWASGGYGTDDRRAVKVGGGGTLAPWVPGLGFQVGYERESTQGYRNTPVQKAPVTGAATVPVTGGEQTTDPTGEKEQWIVGWKGKNGARRESLDGKLRWAYGNGSSLALSGWSGSHEYWYRDPESDLTDAAGNPVYGSTTGGSVNAGLPSGQVVAVKPSDFTSGSGRETNSLYALTWDHKTAALGVWAQVAQNAGVNGYSTPGSAAQLESGAGKFSETDTDSLLSELRFQVPAGASHLFTVGGAGRRDNMDVDEHELTDWTDSGSKTKHTYHAAGKALLWSGFLQDEWAVLPSVTLFPGLRYDHWKLSDGEAGAVGSETEVDGRSNSAWSPRLNANWKATDSTVVKVGAGRAFRAPNLYELFRTWQSGSTLYQGNPDLEPETVWTYEAGVDQYLQGKKTRLTARYFHNDIDDLIYRKQVSPTQKRSENAGEGKTDGVELEWESQWTGELRTWANAAWTQAVIEKNDADPASEGKYVPGVPKWAASAGGEWQAKYWTASLSGRYVGKIYQSSDNSDTEQGVYMTNEPVFLADARVAVRPVQYVEASLAVENLFDKEYWAYYQAPGRTWLAELKLTY